MTTQHLPADLASLHAAAGNLQIAAASIVDAVAQHMAQDAAALIYQAIQRLHSQQVIERQAERDRGAIRSAVIHQLGGNIGGDQS